MARVKITPEGIKYEGKKSFEDFAAEAPKCDAAVARTQYTASVVPLLATIGRDGVVVSVRKVLN